MSGLSASSSQRTAAVRIFGTTGTLPAALLVTVLVARPDMLMTAMHAAMGMVR